MSGAITKAQTLENLISISNMHADDAAWLRTALSQPAPSPQPAVPGVSDEQIEREYERVMGQHLRPQDRAGVLKVCRAILALRPAVEPMTEWEIADIFERWDNTSGASMSDFVRMVEAHHGITAKAEDAHQPTKEAEKL